MSLEPLSAQIVGSYTKPTWLCRHQRMRAHDGSWWRPEPAVLAEAKTDAVRLAIYEQERAGLSIVTDGEAQRAAYDRDFVAALSGIDTKRLKFSAITSDYKGERDDTGWEEYTEFSSQKPTVVAPIEYSHSISDDEIAFAKSVATRPLKANIVGPVTLALQLIDETYHDDAGLILALAEALNQQLRAMEAAGADVLQIDEPGWHDKRDLVRLVGRRAIEVMRRGVSKPIIVHVCYGYAIVYKNKQLSEEYPRILQILADCPIDGISLEYEQPGHQPDILTHCGDKHVLIGLLDLSKMEAETTSQIAMRLRDALDVVPADRLHPASDCGLWHLPRAVAFAKISALGKAAAQIRSEIA